MSHVGTERLDKRKALAASLHFTKEEWAILADVVAYACDEKGQPSKVRIRNALEKAYDMHRRMHLLDATRDLTAAEIAWMLENAR